MKSYLDLTAPLLSGCVASEELVELPNYGVDGERARLLVALNVCLDVGAPDAISDVVRRRLPCHWHVCGVSSWSRQGNDDNRCDHHQWWRRRRCWRFFFNEKGFCPECACARATRAFLSPHFVPGGALLDPHERV